MPEVVKKGKRFNGGTGFAGNQEHCAAEIESGLDGSYCVGVRAVQHDQFGIAGCWAKGASKYLRGQTRSTHPQQDNAARALLHDLLGKPCQVVEVLMHHVRQREPA